MAQQRRTSRSNGAPASRLGGSPMRPNSPARAKTPAHAKMPVDRTARLAQAPRRTRGSHSAPSYAGAKPARDTHAPNSQPRPRAGTSGRIPKASTSGKIGRSGSLPRVSATNEREPGTISIPGLLDGERITLTRRQALAGVAGVAALAAAAVGGRAFSDMRARQNEVDVLEVPEDAVFGLDECETLEADDCMRLQAEIKLPYRTLVWASCDSYACCLLPTKGAAPLSQIAVAALGDGTVTTVVEAPVTQGNGFDIMDARCNDQGILWVEANAFTDEWRVYHATFSGDSIGNPVLADSGDGDFDIPSITVAGGRAFWQVLPKRSTFNPPNSLLKAALFGSEVAQVAYESAGRMATPPYAAAEGVVATPRADTSTVHYQLTLIGADDLQVKDTLVMPTSMAPLAAGYVDGRFAFAFDAIYDYGKGLAKLGTYVPVDQGDPTTGASWFCFGRNPSAAPAWCGNWLIVKSTRSVSGVDIASRTAFALDCPDHCDTFGDFLATTGTRKTIATYLHYKNGDDAYTLLRTWSAV